jgi:hypothetical protein
MRRDRRSENPFVGHARKERVLLIGTDQWITSGPAATTAALKGRIHGCTRTLREKVRFFSLAPRAPSIHGCTRTLREKVRFFSLAPRAPSIHDPSVWSGRAMQEVRRPWSMWSCITVSGLCLERLLRAIMDISAHNDLILGKASNGLVGSPVFARAGKTDHSIVVSSSRRPRRGNSREASSSIISFPHAVPLFVPGGRSFVPACGCTGAPRAKGSQGWPSR